MKKLLQSDLDHYRKYLKPKDIILKRAKNIFGKNKKTALVVRYGGFGDLLMVTPVFRKLKEDGYYTVLNCHDKGNSVLTCNPNIDAKILQKADYISNDDLGKYWDEMAVGFDKFINLSGSIEDSLMYREGTMEFHLPSDKRHEKCNKNYQDNTMEISGYDIKGSLPELYFSKKEHEWARKFVKSFKGKFLVMWSLSGSAIHKAYPYTEYVACEFLEQYPDTAMITVGDEACIFLEWEHPRTKNLAGKLNIRKTMLLTQYVDLVVGTETGVLNAASCFDVPKIIILSHSSVENLTKYWKNTYSVVPPTSCHPCHQIHYTTESCKLNSLTKTPLCMTMVRPESVLIPMIEIYEKSRRKIA